MVTNIEGTLIIGLIRCAIVVEIYIWNTPISNIVDTTQQYTNRIIGFFFNKTLNTNETPKIPKRIKAPIDN